MSYWQVITTTPQDSKPRTNPFIQARANTIILREKLECSLTRLQLSEKMRNKVQEYLPLQQQQQQQQQTIACSEDDEISLDDAIVL